MAAFVQRLFKKHAGSMPRFIKVGYEHESLDRFNRLFMVTECSSGAPSWDLQRPGHYFHEQCNLYTRITNI
jgi:hypothetical protein